MLFSVLLSVKNVLSANDSHFHFVKKGNRKPVKFIRMINYYVYIL